MNNLAVNIDIDSEVTPFFDSVVESGNITKESLERFIDFFAGRQVTDLYLDVFCQFSATPSKVFTTAAEKAVQREENGIPVNYAKEFGSMYNISVEHGIDPYAVWFARCREKGLRPWLSVRMNDCHCPELDTCFLRPDFFYEARRNGWMIGGHYGHFRNCLNYAVPQVRAKMLEYIEEQLMRYDVCGLELDFLREIHCFDYVNEKDCHLIMNEFMRAVKGIATRAAARHGHPVRVAARVMRDIGQNKVFGLDTVTWAREGLVDTLTVTPRWTSCDSNMPIAEWMKNFPDTEVLAGIEAAVLKLNKRVPADADTANGYAAAYLSEGADGIYLFNYFESFKYTSSAKRNLDIYERSGNIDTAVNSTRRHVVTCQDTVPEGCAQWKPLPAAPGAKVEVLTGKIPAGAKVSLVVGLRQDAAEPLKVILNGTTIERFADCDIRDVTGTAEAPAPDVVVRSADATGLCCGNMQSVSLPAESAATLEYVEIKIGF